MAANLTSGNLQRYESPGLNILTGLQPDIVAIQEFNVSNSFGINTPVALSNMIATTFGTNFVYFRETGYSIPNGIISRYPMIASGSWIDSDTGVNDRGFAWARLDLPGYDDLYVVSVHLKAGSSPSDEARRAAEAAELKDLITTNFPANAWIIVAGDMNIFYSDVGSTMAVFNTFLSDNPLPADQNGDVDTNASRAERYDRVLSSVSLTNKLGPIVMPSRTYTNGLVFDSRVYTPLSEVPPVVSTDSGAFQMQHMAVMRNYLLPVSTNSPLLVTTTNDTGPGSLRQAILNASPITAETITFAPHVTETITLTSGPIVLNKSVNIAGPTNTALAASGNNSNRVFHVTAGVVRMSHLTIANGLANPGGGILMDSGNLELNSCQIVSNATTFFGDGGGIYARSNAIVTLNYCSVTHNTASRLGGGICVVENAFALVYSSTIASNRVTYVFDGIFGSFGGGIGMNGGFLNIRNSTIASNVSAYYSGGIVAGVYVAGTAIAGNTIIAGNTAAAGGPDINGTYISGGYNLIGNNSGVNSGFTDSTDQLNVNPLLGPLGTYGGPTLTMGLRSGSPAIDKGKSFGWLRDQRGAARPLDDPDIANASGGDGADIGAYEADPRFRIASISRVGNDVGVSLITMLGKNYSAAYAPDLDAMFWPVFTNYVPGNGHWVWVTNFGGANLPRRFYRADNALD